MTDKQPEALRLADMFEAGNCGYPSRAAAELRRLHSVNAQLLEALERLVNDDEYWDAMANARAAIAAAKETA